MDPYDILGLRPQASAQEIELAYKGRRTQYHPDRYTDPEGARWATGKMQEVNAAYAILSDSGRKAQYDRGAGRPTATRSGSSQKSQAAAASADATTLSLKQALTQAFSVGLGCRRVFVAPNIPLAKLTGALQSYGRGKGVRDIVALVDTTMMGGAREGLMLTEEELLHKELMQQPGALPWSHVREIEAIKEKVQINGRTFMECTLVDAHEIKRLCEGVAGFLASRQQVGSNQGQRSEQRSSKSSAAVALHETAKTEIVKLCRMLDEVEPPGHELIDRDHVVEYFELLRRAAHDPEMQGLAEQELKLIIGLTHLPQIIIANARDERLAVLLASQDTDSPLVQQLRALMRQMRDFALHEAAQAREEEQRRARSDAFFGRR